MQFTFKKRKEARWGPVYDVFVDGRPVGEVDRLFGKLWRAFDTNDDPFPKPRKRYFGLSNCIGSHFKTRQEAAEALWD